MKGKEVLPNFLVVGAARSGTTSLFHYLKQHPQIFLPKRKECRFLSGMSRSFQGPGDQAVNDSIIDSFAVYKSLFSDGKNAIARGDVSPDYLFYFDVTISNIKRFLSPEVKIIIGLRNPVERAYSQFLFFKSQGREHLSFEQALEAEEWRKANNWEWAWRYKEVGFYYEQVKAFLNEFGEDRVLIYLFEEFRESPEIVVRDIFSFLGVNEDPVHKIERYNVSGIPKSKLLHSFLNRPSTLKNTLKRIFPEGSRKKIAKHFRNINLKKPRMRAETRKQLIKEFRQDIEQLQKLINKDLTAWLI